MARIAFSSLVFCWLLSVVQTGNAQLVRVGPGGAVSVRAPFVRVDVGPYGGTYVRAPFTSVYTPRFPGRVRYYGFPAVPYDRYDIAPFPAPVRDAETDLAQMSLPELHGSLVAHWIALQQDLSRFATGASWRHYLQLPADMITEHAEPLAVARPELLQLKKLLGRYDRVAGAFEYRAISRLARFQATRRVLSLYLARLSEASVTTPPAEELPPPLPVPPQL